MSLLYNQIIYKAGDCNRNVGCEQSVSCLLTSNKCKRPAIFLVQVGDLDLVNLFLPFSTLKLESDTHIQRHETIFRTAKGVSSKKLLLWLIVAVYPIICPPLV